MKNNKNRDNKSNKGNKGNKHGMVALITILSLTVVTFMVVLYAYFVSGTGNESYESYAGNSAIDALATEAVSVKINMENCTMKVGTKTQVMATIYPNGSNSGIMWTSSDENVFTVDSKGNIEVIGTGIVALTATFGSATDSIAIECIASEEEAVLKLPDYSVFGQINPQTSQTGNNSAGNTTAGNGTSGAQASEGTTTPSIPVTPTTTATGTTAATTTTATTAATTTQATTAKATTPGVTAGASNATTYSAETTTQYGGTKVLSTEIAGQLTDFGFTKYLDNTYVYGESDDYLGEVIITSNMTHIYVKESNSTFDGTIADILTVLLPDSNGTVMNVYNSASADQTMTLDGRMVRVVVPADGGHKQIVIYN